VVPGLFFEIPMLYDSLSTLQLAFRIVTNVLLASGATGLLWAGYLALFRPRRPRSGPAPRSLAKLSLLALSVGAALYAATYHYIAPRRHPPVTLIDTKEHYRGTVPAIDLSAPPGWTLRRTLSPDKLSFQVQAIQESPPVTMSIETMSIDGYTAPDKTLDMITDALSKVGVTVEPSRLSDTVADKPARGLLGQRADGLRLAIWLVPLAGTVVATVQCASPTDLSPRTACNAPLKNLRWTLP
jgi:hypothetical protein